MPVGRAGDGMVHRITWRVGSTDALDFWAERLGDEGHDPERDGERLRFRDFEGLGLELAVVDTPDPPLIAEHPEIPRELALQGFDGVRAYAADPERSRPLFEEALAFEPAGDGWEARGERRGGLLRLRRSAAASAACRARAPCTTSPGRPTTRSTRPGASG